MLLCAFQHAVGERLQEAGSMIQALGNRVRGLGELTKRFIQQPSGTTAVEFGLLAVPFFFLKFAIIETAIVFWAGQLLESGVTDASSTDSNRPGADTKYGPTRVSNHTLQRTWVAV
ncbi:TadE/TadG family type IV pilus assembly protein [Ahrensia marina]|uniref:TadE/TadG family type IV pilus assembly protein n=1 Tax=Ahrensia marina TaxID=1514904 RepID=UPI0035CE8770